MKLKEEFDNVARLKYFRQSTISSYWDHSRQLVRFLKAKSRSDLVDNHDRKVADFLTAQARRGVASATQLQSLNALNFLYGEVLKTPLGKLPEFERPARRCTLPEVPATHDDMMRLLNALAPATVNFIGRLLYGCALRVNDALRIRLRDLDFANNEIIIRGSKGDKDRVVPLPSCLRDELQSLTTLREAQHLTEKRSGQGWVWLPGLYGLKNPKAHFDTAWQYLFASENYSTDPESGNRGRHHITAEAIQQAFRRACESIKLKRRVTPHSCRHAAAREMERRRVPLASIQAMLGHANVETTLRYLGAGAKIPKAISPLD